MVKMGREMKGRLQVRGFKREIRNWSRGGPDPSVEAPSEIPGLLSCTSFRLPAAFWKYNSRMPSKCYKNIQNSIKSFCTFLSSLSFLSSFWHFPFLERKGVICWQLELKRRQIPLSSQELSSFHSYHKCKLLYCSYYYIITLINNTDCLVLLGDV